MPPEIAYALDDPERLASAHERARAGDAGAVNEVVVMFGRWVSARAKFPPAMVDADDAESFARESVWVACLRCESPFAIAGFARSTFRNKVMTHRRAAGSRLPAKNLKDWAGVAGPSVRFPTGFAGPLKRGERTGLKGPPCVTCGTDEGWVMPGRTIPYRASGRCRACYVKAWKAARGAGSTGS